MFINAFGSRDNPTIVLLAPMMVSGTDLHDLMQPHFKGDYHIVAPDQGGHGKAGAYRSADGDDAGYGNLHPKLIWGRTKTIGRGGDCCDFLLEYKE